MEVVQALLVLAAYRDAISTRETVTRENHEVVHEGEARGDERFTLPAAVGVERRGLKGHPSLTMDVHIYNIIGWRIKRIKVFVEHAIASQYPITNHDAGES